ncbi:MAG: cyclic nucleotide-binding domain-containing protein [Leptolyngbyaceae cyanobacterium bins.349]|nr:cyclic nucleotide-binding domain-containing protein [Leptolyngbyaceae cyanobacterium bins.349]
MRTVLFLLGELDDDDIDWMIERGDRRTVTAGTVLIQEGQPINHLFILLEGALSVSVMVTGGQEIASLLSGDIVGEMSFVDTRPPSATVTAKQDSLVLCLSREELAAKLHLDVGFAARFYRALAISLSNRLRLTVSHLKDLNLPTSTDTSTDHDLPFSDLARNAQENVALANTRLDWLLRRLKDEVELK